MDNKRKASELDNPGGSTANKKRKYDLAAVLKLLKGADPNFIDFLWTTSNENVTEFNNKIYDAFRTNNYMKLTPAPKIRKEPQVQNRPVEDPNPGQGQPLEATQATVSSSLENGQNIAGPLGLQGNTGVGALGLVQNNQQKVLEAQPVVNQPNGFGAFIPMGFQLGQPVTTVVNHAQTNTAFPFSFDQTQRPVDKTLPESTSTVRTAPGFASTSAANYTPALTFGTATASAANYAPAFTFGTATASAANYAPGFGSVASTSAANNAPAFRFGTATTSAANNAPGFSFGIPSTSAANNAPAFRFGTATTSAANNAPGFSFGIPSTSAANNAPALSAADNVPRFTFGETESTIANNAPAFTFGIPSTSAANNAPVFMFGATASSTVKKAQFDEITRPDINSEPSKTLPEIHFCVPETRPVDDREPLKTPEQGYNEARNNNELQNNLQTNAADVGNNLAVNMSDMYNEATELAEGELENNENPPVVVNEVKIPNRFTFSLPEILYEINALPNLINNNPEIPQPDTNEVNGAEDMTLTCECCADEDIKLLESVECDKGQHTFCQDCLKQCCEQTIAKAEAYPKCMADCEGSFTINTLREVLPPPLLETLLQKQQQAEISQAQVEGLEDCPFCYFAYVPPVDDAEFVCQNPECGKTSCRQCKKVSHAPNQCERDETLSVNHKIEEAMTNELIVTCPQCGKAILKTDGCNKLTCVCGAYICYVCKQRVDDYGHFNRDIPGWIAGGGNDGRKKCKLYTNLRTPAQIKAAGRKVRDAELRKTPGVQLNNDPTKFAMPRKTKYDKRR